MIAMERHKHYVLRILSSGTCPGDLEMEMVWVMLDMDHHNYSWPLGHVNYFVLIHQGQAQLAEALPQEQKFHCKK